MTWESSLVLSMTSSWLNSKSGSLLCRMGICQLFSSKISPSILYRSYGHNSLVSGELTKLFLLSSWMYRSSSQWFPTFLGFCLTFFDFFNKLAVKFKILCHFLSENNILTCPGIGYQIKDTNFLYHITIISYDKWLWLVLT